MSQSDNDGLPLVLRWVTALIVLIVFTGLVLWMVLKAEGTDEGVWSRYLFLYIGIEAIAFTAVGWVFGREVNRERATAAEERTRQAEEALVRRQTEVERIIAETTDRLGVAEARRSRAEEATRSLAQAVIVTQDAGRASLAGGTFELQAAGEAASLAALAALARRKLDELQ